MKKEKVVIVDYGLGNLFNLQRAIEKVGGESEISENREQILNADKLLLPGVGAFEKGMKGLNDCGLTSTIIEFANSGRQILGICLGMQLLMSYSEEHGLHKGLGLIKGRVVRFKESIQGGELYKIPQIGWNILKLPEQLQKVDKFGKPIKYLHWKETILKDLADALFMYFLHSYIVVLDNPEDCLASTEYGQDKFCSVVGKDNIVGCQFHPERSGNKGLKILKNFIFQI